MNINSILSKLPTYDEASKNNKNLSYPLLQIVSGKSGSGKTHLVLKELLTPGFLDYKEIYVLSPNINTKEYQFLKHGFEHNINKEILLEIFPNLNKFRLNQIPEVLEIIAQNMSLELKQNNIKSVFTSKKEELPTKREMNPDLPKLFIFDDLAGDREFQDIIRNFYSKGRPNNCMCIYITQKISEVQPKSIRDNRSNLILFKTAGCSFDKVYSDMAREVMENKKEIKILCERIWRDKYAYVYINKINDLIINDIFSE